ncbi:MAG: tyrosine-type recombinase/integrase [bacterium]
MASIFKRKNSNSWHYSISFNGRHYQGSTKTTDKKTAQQIADAIQTDLARDEHKLPVRNKSVANFATAWNSYIKNINVSPKTREVRITAGNHFLPYFQSKDVNDITIQNVENYQLQRKLEILKMPKNLNKRENEISFRSANIEVGTLSNFFNYCIKNGYIEKNPATGIKKLNELSRLKTLSSEEINRLLSGATNKLTRDIMTFLIYTGCRKGEALNLKWEDVDMQNDIIAIKGTKTKLDRYIPISDALRGHLGGIDRNQDSLYVFEYKGRKLTDFKRSFGTACRNAGIKDLTKHDLRHVFGSKMVQGGTSLYITGELLGHRTTQMTKRYSHLVPDTLKKAVNDVFKGYGLSEPAVKITKNTFVIADTHFGDSEKEKFLIDNWNSAVGKNDDVLHLGDFISEGKSAVVEENIKKYAGLLNGRIFLIRGNHDSAPAETYEKAGIKVINEYPGGHAAAVSASIGGIKILFSHYPVKNIDAALSDDTDIFEEATDYLSGIFDEKRFDINIHGHVHRKLGSFENLINVSPENTDYKPVRVKDVLKRFLENRNAVKP